MLKLIVSNNQIPKPNQPKEFENMTYQEQEAHIAQLRASAEADLRHAEALLEFGKQRFGSDAMEQAKMNVDELRKEMKSA